MRETIRDKLEDKNCSDEALLQRIIKRKKEHKEWLTFRRIKYDPKTKSIVLGKATKLP